MTVTELIDKYSLPEIGNSKSDLREFSIELLDMVNTGGVEEISGNEVDGYSVIHTYKVAIVNALEELRK